MDNNVHGMVLLQRLLRPLLPRQLLLLPLMPPCENIAAAAAKLQPLQPRHCRRCCGRQICTTVAMVAKRNRV